MSFQAVPSSSPGSHPQSTAITSQSPESLLSSSLSIDPSGNLSPSSDTPTHPKSTAGSNEPSLNPSQFHHSFELSPAAFAALDSNLLSDAASMCSVSSADTTLTTPDLALSTSSSDSTVPEASPFTSSSPLSSSLSPSTSSTMSMNPSPTAVNISLPSDTSAPSAHPAADSADQNTSNTSHQILGDIPSAPDIVFAANDDSVIAVEPSRHVDYLSHNWKESDISSSWRYIVLRRKDVANSARLENASWRTWAKARNNLKTVSPESVNWLKDYDVTWLYGPLATQTSKPFAFADSGDSTPRVDSTGAGALSPPLRSSNPTSAAAAVAAVAAAAVSVSVSGSGSSTANHNNISIKKPILKKRSMSEVMLSRSLSSSNLIKQAASSVAAERHLRAPGTTATTSSFSNRGPGYSGSMNSGTNTDDRRSDPRFPSALVARSYAASNANFSDRLTAMRSTEKTNRRSTKHIHFNDRVEQCIALDEATGDERGGNAAMFSDGGYYYDDDYDGEGEYEDDEEEDDYENEDDDEPGLFLMVRSGSGSFQRPTSLEPHTIAKLPATKLKVPDYEGMDTHDAVEDTSGSSRPLFSMGEEDEEEDDNEEEDGYFSSRDVADYQRHYYGNQSLQDEGHKFEVDEEQGEKPNEEPESPEEEGGLRRTTSYGSISEEVSIPRLSMREPMDGHIEDIQSLENSEESNDDGDDIVDMDSSLLTNLRRDSVVLARGRINEPGFLTSPLLSKRVGSASPVGDGNKEDRGKDQEIQGPQDGLGEEATREPEEQGQGEDEDKDEVQNQARVRVLEPDRDQDQEHSREDGIWKQVQNAGKGITERLLGGWR
ncbi:uncharacterized protein V1516DRAFT_685922 [Lipomyces oligophaga]|uniref:uncharacterized protein n=1 Tax=Lipomyces oligophaga TaxID=45792 RepID=UPI0034D00725